MDTDTEQAQLPVTTEEPIPAPQPEPPKTVAVVGIDLSKTRELVVRVKYDKVIPRRFHVDIELTNSLGQRGGARGKLADKSFAVAAQSFEEVYAVLPGLIRAATAKLKG